MAVFVWYARINWNTTNLTKNRMTIKRSAAVWSLMAAIALLGAGCANTIVTPPVTEEPAEATTQPTDEAKAIASLENDEIASAAVDPSPESPCPEGLIRYWTNGPYGQGLTFCHEAKAIDGTMITVARAGEAVIIYPDDNVASAISIIPFQLGKSADGAQEIIERKFMTVENRTACEVVRVDRAYGTEFAIANGDLDTQTSCGEFGNGFFLAKPSAGRLFFVRAQQDGFLPSETWLSTLEAVFASEGDPTDANGLAWLTEGGLTTYRNANIGVSFAYPSNWGPVLQNDEGGQTDWTGDTDPLATNCTSQSALAFAALGEGTIALAAGNTGGCGVPGRGGYFGDQAQGFRSPADIDAWCSEHDVCETFTNPNGIRVAHAHTKQLEDWGTTYDGVDEYAIFHPNADLAGIILSNQRLIAAGLGRQESALRAIVDSLTFVK